MLIETQSVNMFPIFDPYAALVYSANPSNVEMVFVDGKCLVKDKQLVHYDLSELRQDLIKEMEEFSKKAMEYDIKE